MSKKPISMTNIVVYGSVAAALLFVLYMMNVSFSQRLTSVNDALLRTTKSHSQLLFCYNHDIKPCSLVELEAWNKKNPDAPDKFVPGINP